MLQISSTLLKIVDGGYEFFADRGLVTIFSAPDYCGEFGNSGAIMSVDQNLRCSFRVGSAFLVLAIAEIAFQSSLRTVSE